MVTSGRTWCRAHLRALLAAHPNFRPGDLELQVLETRAMEDLAKVSRVIDACRKVGVCFALDGFGTGYSSLTYFKQLPVATIKIDQTSVRNNMLNDTKDQSILRSVISLSDAFPREVIAEGVEMVEYGAMLLRPGCYLAQRYGIAHPMPAHKLPVWPA